MRTQGDFPSIDQAFEDEKTPIPTEPWPDFEPRTFPSEEIEAIDESATPATVEPAFPRSTAPNDAVVQGPVAAVRVPQMPVQEPTLPTQNTLEDNAWDLLGESDGRGRPAVDDDRTGPGSWATPSPAPSDLESSDPLNATPRISGRAPRVVVAPPLVKSSAAPVRPKADEEAQYDAIIAEVERSKPARRSSRGGSDAPRRKPGPFSRGNEDAESSDPGERRRSHPSRSEEGLEQPEERPEVPRNADSYDEVFPSISSAARDEETAALLMDAADPAVSPLNLPEPPRASPFDASTATPLSAALRSPAAAVEIEITSHGAHDLSTEEEENDPSTKTDWRRHGPGGVDLDERPLADEKTEIRSFSPKIDTVGDEPEEKPSEEFVVDEGPTAPQNPTRPVITAADLPKARPFEASPQPPVQPEATSMPTSMRAWVSVGAGMVFFLLPVALIVALGTLYWYMWG